jgi:hypothetical protein
MLRSLIAKRYKQPAGRGFTVYPDDTILVSYPRSGNTWLRFILAALLQPDRVQDFRTISASVPDIYRVSDRVLRRRSHPRVVKSHEPFDPRYGRTIYLVRDPRDVAASYYHYLAHFRPERPDTGFEEFVEGFIAGNVPFGSWNEHVAGWLSHRGNDKDFLVVRYEDIHSDPPAWAKRVAAFVGLAPNHDRIDSAVRQASFDEMRTVEDAYLGPITEDARFVRSGRREGWRTEMDPSTADRIANAFRPAMDLAGYR